MGRTRSVFRYRIRNWREYNRALVNRGRLTVWFDENALTAWRNTEPAVGPGAPCLYADLAIECPLVLKAVFHLSLRATQGFLSSVIELMALALPVPDYSTISRRQSALQVRMSLTPQTCPRHVVIDATGLKVYGAGEWHAGKRDHQRDCRRRAHRELCPRQPTVTVTIGANPRSSGTSVRRWSLRHAGLLRGSAAAWRNADLRAPAHGAPVC